MILAFDTSTALTSVALVDGNDVVEHCELDSRRHAEVLAPLLKAVLRDSGVDISHVSTIACGVGPGPYTGLRVGIASARAIGLAWQRPVVGLCSLDAVAAAFVDAGMDADFAVASDARRREVYWAVYSAEGTRLRGPLVGRPADLPGDMRALPWVGHGAVVHADEFRDQRFKGEHPTSALLYPHAAWIGWRVALLLAHGANVADPRITLAQHGDDGEATSDALSGAELLAAEPLYLRRPDITLAGAS